MRPIKSLLRVTGAALSLPVFLVGLLGLHENRLSVIADTGNEAQREIHQVPVQGSRGSPTPTTTTITRVLDY